VWPSEPQPQVQYQQQDRINFLLMGIDLRPGEYGPARTDTLIIVTLDPVEVEASGRDPRELVQEVVDDVNRDRARVEQIKRFAIVPRDFLQEEGEVTPTLKLKRRVVEEHFAEEIEALYR